MAVSHFNMSALNGSKGGPFKLFLDDGHLDPCMYSLVHNFADRQI